MLYSKLLTKSMYQAAFKNIDDTLRKDAGCSSELDYIEQTSWVLFLKYLDDFEADKETAAELNGKTYRRIIDGEYRWASWAAPKRADGKLDYNAALTGTLVVSSKALKTPKALITKSVKSSVSYATSCKVVMSCGRL
jgi:hypothetical protein